MADWTVAIDDGLVDRGYEMRCLLCGAPSPPCWGLLDLGQHLVVSYSLCATCRNKRDPQAAVRRLLTARYA
jgi:hypothetical protein